MNELPAIEPSVETFFWLSSAWKNGWPEGWVKRELFVESVQNQIVDKLQRYGPKVSRPYPALSEDIVSRLVEAGAIKTLTNPVSGDYHHIENTKLTQYRNNWVANDDLAKQHSAIGSRLFEDIFAVYTAASGNAGFRDGGMAEAAPASDRVVKFSDNSAPFAEAVSRLDDFLAVLDSTNDYGEMTDPEIEVAKLEVREIAEALKSGLGRPRRLWNQAKSTFGWIGTVAAEAVIGAAAMGILALLYNLLKVYL